VFAVVVGAEFRLSDFKNFESEEIRGNQTQDEKHEEGRGDENLRERQRSLVFTMLSVVPDCAKVRKPTAREVSTWNRDRSSCPGGQWLRAGS